MKPDDYQYVEDPYTGHRSPKLRLTFSVMHLPMISFYGKRPQASPKYIEDEASKKAWFVTDPPPRWHKYILILLAFIAWVLLIMWTWSYFVH